MKAPIPWIPETLSSWVVTTIILILWAWGTRGHSMPLHAGYFNIMHRRAVSLSICFAALLVLSLLGEDYGLVGHVILSLAMAFIFCLHAALEPTRETFWHHRRLRPLGVLASALTAVTVAVLAGSAQLVNLLAAVAIYHRHHQALSRLLCACLEDLAAIRSKLLLEYSLAATQRQLDVSRKREPNGKEKRNDKDSKAG